MKVRATMLVLLAALVLPGCTPLILAVAGATAGPEHAGDDVHDTTSPDVAPTDGAPATAR